MSKPKSKHPPLQILKQKLESNGFSASYLPAGSEADVAFDSLLIALDEESEETPLDAEAQYILQAFFVEDMMKAEAPDLPAEETPDFSMLQMMVELPVNWQELSTERQLEGLQLLNICSQKIPFGHFSQEGESLVYTYSFLADSQRIDGDLFLSALDMLSFFINRMPPVLSAFAAENLSLSQAIDRLDHEILD